MRRIVVSGGGTGIGRAIARRFALSGDEVTIVGRREHVLAAAATEITAETPGDVCAVAGDLSQADDVGRIAAEITAAEPSIDVLVNNAGGVVSVADEGLAATASDWEEQFRANVLTAVLLTEALEPALRRPGASVINVSSIAAVNGGGDSYSGAKAAILGWTLDLAIRLGSQGIRVNAIVPGYVQATEFFGDRMTEERHNRLVARTLLGRAGDPADVAGCAYFLASDDAAYVTGQFLHVNGGAVLGR
jgi:NAD(P)-dependent dehydrogenase (short-subunit alcohol dehydrogenase family)